MDGSCIELAFFCILCIFSSPPGRSLTELKGNVCGENRSTSGEQLIGSGIRGSSANQPRDTIQKRPEIASAERCDTVKLHGLLSPFPPAWGNMTSLTQRCDVVSEPSARARQFRPVKIALLYWSAKTPSRTGVGVGAGHGLGRQPEAGRTTGPRAPQTARRGTLHRESRPSRWPRPTRRAGPGRRRRQTRGRARPRSLAPPALGGGRSHNLPSPSPA